MKRTLSEDEMERISAELEDEIYRMYGRWLYGRIHSGLAILTDEEESDCVRAEEDAFRRVMERNGLDPDGWIFESRYESLEIDGTDNFSSEL